MRRLAIIGLPFQKPNNQLNQVIRLFSILLTYHRLIEENLKNISEIELKLLNSDSEFLEIFEKETEIIPTFETPRKK